MAMIQRASGPRPAVLGSVIAITVWKNTGYYMLFFLAGLAGVPQDLLDAATIDGAGALRRFGSITLPMLGPAFGFVLPIALLNALTQVDHVVTMTQGGPCRCRGPEECGRAAAPLCRRDRAQTARLRRRDR
jgi:ABC-type sugar transport system permease subunit